MSHNLMQRSDGKGHALFWHSESPWHGLGTQLNGPATSKEAITAAGLDWPVKKYELMAMHDEGGEHNALQVPDKFATVREDGERRVVLGVVGKQYTPLQNTEAFGFFDNIVGEGQAIYHTAGALGQGERIWVLVKLPDSIRVLKGDVVDKYLLLYNTHDGSSSVGVKFTPIRVVCQNTLQMATGDGKKAYKVRHFPDVAVNLDKVADLMGIVRKSYDQIEELIRETAKVPMNNERAVNYFKAVVLDDPKAVSQDEIRRNDRNAFIRNEMLRLSNEGRGSNIPGVRGSLWGALNGVTEFVDYQDTRRGGGEGRLERILFGTGSDLKARSFAMATKIVDDGPDALDAILKNAYKGA